MILVCDVNVLKHGHYIGFNQFIVDHTAVIGSEVMYLFNAESKEYLDFSGKENVHFIDIPPRWRGSIAGKFRIWRLIVDKVKELDPDAFYFLDFDKFQFPIGLIAFPCSISGIYFRPHHRIRSANDKLFGKAKAFFKRQKKIFAEKLLLHNRKITSIFILNDESGVKTLNDFYGTTVFKYLPDPIFDYAYNEREVTKNSNKISFLIFGALTERKNISNLIKAFGKANFNKQALLRIIGSCDSASYKSYLSDLAQSEIDGQEKLKEILIKTEFVTDEEMEVYHASSDVSLLLYKDFFGSSGLLGRAAKHNLVVLSPSVGLLHDLTESNKLGLTVDPTDISAIVIAMQKAEELARDLPAAGHQNFYKAHLPEKFIKTLFH